VHSVEGIGRIPLCEELQCMTQREQEEAYIFEEVKHATYKVMEEECVHK
jgi:hypothetical protein